MTSHQTSSPLRNRHASENEDLGVRARRETGSTEAASSAMSGATLAPSVEIPVRIPDMSKGESADQIAKVGRSVPQR
jgi:hypothetical protein